MPFRRSRGNQLRPVNRIKHVFDVQDAITIGAPNTQEPIVTVDNPVIANTNEVETGSIVNGIYIKCEATRTGTSSDVLANLYFIVTKNPGGNLTIGNGNVIGGSDNKRFTIHQEMIMLSGAQFGPPRTVFNGVVVIPKAYRRFGPDDRLQIQLFSPGVTANFCLQCHYKEFK